MSSFQNRLKDWRIERRRFLYAAGGFAGLVATSRLQALVQAQTPSFTSNPFTLGVASGDPGPDSVVLWSRLAPEPLAADGLGGMDPVRVPVSWAVATDEQMQQVVRHGLDVPANAAVLLSENPHIKFVNGQRGYAVCDMTRERCRTEYKTVPFVTSPGAPITTRATFTVLSGEPQLIEGRDT